MVVVYKGIYHMNEGEAGLLASGVAYSALFSLVLFRMIKTMNAEKVHACVILADTLTLVTGLLLLFAGTTFVFTILTALFIYPSVVVGSALSNSHPVKYQQKDHPLLNVRAILLQQEIVQAALGPAVGLYFCRTALGYPVATHNLGIIFVCIAAIQTVIVTLGWNPGDTKRWFTSC